ncbi:MAG: FAD binding domain-containing protein, partial [Burkholderiales bacterium]
AMLAFDTTLTLASASGRRQASLAEAFEKRFAKDEMIVCVDIQAPPPRSGSAFHKFLPRGVMETPTVNTAACITLDARGSCVAARLVVGAVSWKPIVMELDVLHGKTFAEAAIRAAVQPVRDLAQPMANVRGSAQYKRNMAVEIGSRMVIAAWRRAAK